MADLIFACLFRCRLGFVLFSLSLFAISAHARSKPEPPDPSVLLHRAGELSDIWSTGPVRLRIHVKFLAVKAGSINGEYERVSTSWNQWRTNISSQDYNQVSVGGEGRVWKSSDSPDEPIRVWQFERAMAALYQSVVSNDLQYAVHYEHWEGIIGDVPCVTMRDGRLLSNRSRLSNGRLWVKDCFDPKSGALLTLEEAGLTYSYFDYRPFGSKLFPYRYVIAENSSVVVVAQVVELDNPTVVDPNLFNPRSDASVYPVCKDAPGLPLLPSGSKLVHEVNPRSRQLAQAPEGHMDVLVYAILGKDGKLHNLHGVGNSQTRDAAIEAVEQWRFQPYEVCGSPVDQPVGFQLSFTKSGQYTWEPWTP